MGPYHLKTFLTPLHILNITLAHFDFPAILYWENIKLLLVGEKKLNIICATYYYFYVSFQLYIGKNKKLHIVGENKNPMLAFTYHI